MLFRRAAGYYCSVDPHCGPHRLPFGVFVVEDSKDVLDALRTLVSEMESARLVGCAGTVQEAVERIPACQPDVLILDIHLPDGTGLDILKVLRQAGQPLPIVIVLSTETDPRYRKAFESLGAAFYLDKALEFGRLAEICGSLAK